MAQQIQYTMDIPALVSPAHPAAIASMANRSAPAIQAGTPIDSVDLVRAQEEKEKLRDLKKFDIVTDQELSLAAARTHAVSSQVVNAHHPGAAAPAWFFPAMDVALAPLRLDIVSLKQESKRNWNATAGDGISVPWAVVPFDDGADPTQPPHNLPHLHSLQTVRDIPAVQRNAYLTGYGIALVGGQAQRRELLARKLGFRGQL